MNRSVSPINSGLKQSNNSPAVKEFTLMTSPHRGPTYRDKSPILLSRDKSPNALQKDPPPKIGTPTKPSNLSSVGSSIKGLKKELAQDIEALNSFLNGDENLNTSQMSIVSGGQSHKAQNESNLIITQNLPYQQAPSTSGKNNLKNTAPYEPKYGIGTSLQALKISYKNEALIQGSAPLGREKGLLDYGGDRNTNKFTMNEHSKAGFSPEVDLDWGQELIHPRPISQTRAGGHLVSELEGTTREMQPKLPVNQGFSDKTYADKLHTSKELEEKVNKAIQGILTTERETSGKASNTTSSNLSNVKKSYQLRTEREAFDSIPGKKMTDSRLTSQQSNYLSSSMQEFLLGQREYEEVKENNSKFFNGSALMSLNDSARINAIETEANSRIEREYLESLSNHQKMKQLNSSLNRQAEARPGESCVDQSNSIIADEYGSREDALLASGSRNQLERQFMKPLISQGNTVSPYEDDGTAKSYNKLKRLAELVLGLHFRRTIFKIQEAVIECTDLKMTEISKNNIKLLANRYFFLQSKFFIREIPLFLSIMFWKHQQDRREYNNKYSQQAKRSVITADRGCQVVASRTVSRETQYNLDDSGIRLLNIDQFKENLSKVKMNGRKKLRSETMFIVDREMEEENKEKINFFAIQKEFESGMLFDKQNYFKSKIHLDVGKPYEDDEENIVENLLLVYWRIPIKSLTKRAMLIKRYMMKLKLEMTNDGAKIEDLKKRINSCLILCPLLLFQMKFDRAEEHLNTTLRLLEEDKLRKQGDLNRLYSVKECDDLINKCKMWLSWISILKIPDAILGVRQYHLKSASDYFDEAELLNKEKNPVLTKSILDLLIEYNTPSITSIFNPTENAKKKCLKIIDYLPQHKNLLNLIMSSINLDSGDKELEKQAIASLEGQINNKEYIFLCTAKLFKHFTLNSNPKLAWKVANHARAVDAVENDYHQELIWSLWVKASGKAKKTDEAFFKAVIKRLEEYPENLLIFYQFSRVCIKYSNSHYTIAISTVEHLIENLKDSLDLETFYHALFWKGELFKVCLHHKEAGRILEEAKSGFEKLEVTTKKTELIEAYIEKLNDHQEYFNEVLEIITKNTNEDESILTGLWKNFRLNQSLSNLEMFDKFAYSIIELFLNRPKDILPLKQLAENYPSRIECWTVYWSFTYKRFKLATKGWTLVKAPESLSQDHPQTIFKAIKGHSGNIQNTFGSYIGLTCGTLWLLLGKDYGDIDLNETLALMKFKSLLQRNSLKAFDFIQNEIKATHRRPNSILFYFYCRTYISFLGVFTKKELNTEFKKMVDNLPAERKQELSGILNKSKYEEIEKILKKLIVSEFTTKKYKAKINYFLAEGAYINNKLKKEVIGYYSKAEENFTYFKEIKFLKSEKRLLNAKVLQLL